MKLVTRLTALLVSATLCLLLLEGAFSIRREIHLFEADMERDAALVGDALGNIVGDVWRANGQERALQLIEDADRTATHMSVRWVWLDVSSDHDMAPLVSSERLGDARHGHTVFVTDDAPLGESYLFAYFPAGVDTSRAGALEVAQARLPLERYVRTTILTTAILTLALLVMAIGLTRWLGVRSVGKPLHQLLKRMRAIGAGDLDRAVALSGHDEFSDLATGLNQLSVQLSEAQRKKEEETQRRLTAVNEARHAERLRTVGRLASGIAHELGTPLNVVAGRASLITSGELSEVEVIESSAIIESECERMVSIVRQLLDFVRRSPTRSTTTDLAEHVRKTAGLLLPTGQQHGVTVSVETPDTPLLCDVDPQQVQQVVTNLIVNAIQASRPGMCVRVVVDSVIHRQPDDPEGEAEYLRIGIEDGGHGMSPEIREHIFDPFFTTKEVGKGTGLGLSTALGIVQEHGGWIDVESGIGRGSRFAVYLPWRGTDRARDEGGHDGRSHPDCR